MVQKWFSGIDTEEIDLARSLVNSRKSSVLDIERLGFVKDYSVSGTVTIGVTPRLSDGSCLSTQAVDVSSQVNLIYGYYLAASSILASAMSGDLTVRSVDITTNYKLRYATGWTRVSNFWDGNILNAPTQLVTLSASSDPFILAGQYKF